MTEIQIVINEMRAIHRELSEQIKICQARLKSLEDKLFNPLTH